MITDADYAFLSDLLKRHSGLTLCPGKQYLLESRLPPVAVTYGHADLPALIAALRLGAPAPVVKNVCDAMTTGETLFFRDQKPFTTLEQDVLPLAVTRARAAGRPVRIWCAACSTGQEPYSIAMLLEKMTPQLAGTRVELLATDFSDAALARAKAAVYNQFEVQRGLPVQLLVKHFTPVADGFQLKDEVRRRVTFQSINLLNPFPAMWQFDVIFCRNVLIYFDVATKKDVLERMTRLLYQGGTVFLGGTESTLGVTEALVRTPGQPAGVFCRPSDLALMPVPKAA